MVIFRRDSLTGRAWLEFEGKPPEDVIDLLKRSGWRWSGYRKQWNNPRRFVKPPAGIEYTDGGLCDYSTERSERLEKGSTAAAGRAEAARTKMHGIMDRIPLGQPILVGHHSEGRARRDVARIDRAMGTLVEEHKKSEHLAAKAEESARHQARSKSAGVVSRRVDRLRAELRAFERREGQWGDHAAWQERIGALREELARQEALLAEVHPASALEPKAGDLVLIKGWKVRVKRVNPKTISGEIVAGGAAGMSGKWDRSHLQQILDEEE